MKVPGQKLGLAGYVIRGMEMKFYAYVIGTKSHLMAYLLPVKKIVVKEQSLQSEFLKRDDWQPIILPAFRASINARLRSLVNALAGTKYRKI